MAATKAPPAPTQKTPAEAEPVLEHFYTVAQAAVRLNLRDKDDPTTTGEKFLRDGVNKEGWPCHRMARQLLFSDSDLAAIAELNRNKKDARSGPRPSTGRPRRRAAVKTPASATP
jgi:hypothetical protein